MKPSLAMWHKRGDQLRAIRKTRLHKPIKIKRNSNGSHFERVIRIERVMRTHAVELTLPEGVGL